MRLTFAHGLRIAILSTGMMPVSSLMAATTDNWNVEGEHGQFELSGAMTEAPCMMDMKSDFQEVELGPLNNAHMKRAGDEGSKVEFVFNLRHCIASDARLGNAGNGLISGAVDQPIMFVEFVSKGEQNNPDLIEIRGIRGVGLRIVDNRRHTIHLGQFSSPQFLNSGQNLLKYSVVVERTSEKLVLGPFHATVDFKIHYY